MIAGNHNPKPSELAFVPFVSVDDMMRNIRTIGVEKAIVGIAEYIEQDFLRWESFDKKPRIPAHAPQGVIELMPTSDGETFGFKYVNGHPGNTREGMQTVTGFGVLSDLTTGYPLLLTEMTILTALRTAANSALAAKYLAPKGSTTMAVMLSVPPSSLARSMRRLTAASRSSFLRMISCSSSSGSMPHRPSEHSR